MMSKNFGIYVHFPFCEQKCLYCDFASFVCDHKIKEQYLKSLKEEILNFKSDREVSSIYFGGGTPSSISFSYIEEILEIIREKFILKKNVEITIECNPNSTDREKLRRYKEIGINRLSIGVQSFDDKILKEMGRLHNSSQAIEVIKLAKKIGFKNISVDLMVGFKGQTERALLQDISTLSDLKIPHVSIYMLQIEEGASLYKRIREGKTSVLNDDECERIFEKGVEFLKSKGYQRYEISNFAKKGRESKHNRNYWLNGEYIGFGLGAHSFIGGKRIANPVTFEKYFNKEAPLIEELTNKEQIEEIIMLGLRCKYGFKINDLKKMGYNLEKNKEYFSYINKKILRKERGRIFLNPEYYDVSNTIICNLLP